MGTLVTVEGIAGNPCCYCRVYWWEPLLLQRILLGTFVITVEGIAGNPCYYCRGYCLEPLLLL